MFRAPVVEAAARSCGQKVIGACHGGNPRTHWWTLVVMEASKLKKESFRAWLYQESSVAADRFREAQKAAASVVHSKHSDVGGVWARGGLEQYLWSGRLRWWFPSLGDRRVCSNFWGITPLSLPGKVYFRVLERILEQEQCRFHHGCGTTDQLWEGHESSPNQSTCVSKWIINCVRKLSDSSLSLSVD